MEIKVGNTYQIIDNDDDITTLKVVRQYHSGSFQCITLASTCYSEKSELTYSQQSFDDMKQVKFIEGKCPPIEKQTTVKITGALKQLYIEMALQTHDKKWFLELTNTKEGSIINV